MLGRRPGTRWRRFSKLRRQVQPKRSGGADARHYWSGDLGVPPRFLWFTLNLTDRAGHYGGPHSEMGSAAIRDTDARMGEIIDEIERQGDPTDLSVPLRDAGVEHLMVDDQYVYLR